MAALLLTPLILTACGGSPSGKVLHVAGPGFGFDAPARWTVVRRPGSVTASDGDVDLVQVRVLPLVKTYRPARYRAVAAELDRATEALVHQPQLPHARVVEKRDSRIAGRRVRSYRIDFGPGKTEELAYVLQGKTEYLLICRRLTDESDDTCAQLFSSFALNV